MRLEFVAATSASVTVGSALGPFTWGSTTRMVQDVRGWLDTPSANFGWLVRGDESANATAKRFDTRENPVSANRPVVTLDFTTPSAGVDGWTLY